MPDTDIPYDMNKQPKWEQLTTDQVIEPLLRLVQLVNIAANVLDQRGLRTELSLDKYNILSVQVWKKIGDTNANQA